MSAISVHKLLDKKESAEETLAALSNLCRLLSSDSEVASRCNVAVLPDKEHLRSTDKAAVDLLFEAQTCIKDYVQVLDQALRNTKVEWPPLS